MFFAHLPAGYLLTRKMIKYSADSTISSKYLMFIGLVSSIIPDIDILYHVFLDKEKLFHHYYWPHIPFWIITFHICILLVLKLAGMKRFYLAAHIIAANFLLHMVLDTMTTWILWLYPFSMQQVGLTSISEYQFWTESAIIIAAIATFINAHKKRKNTCNF